MPAPVAHGYDALVGPLEGVVFGAHRRDLGEGVEGVVLDLGGGTGRQVEHLLGADHVILIDPDERMLARAARRMGEEHSAVAAQAEALPLADDSCDHVIASLVLCTVRDVGVTLAEVSRVLRPGGQLRFFEHVAAAGVAGRLQRAVDPLWRRVAGGCDLHRKTEQHLREAPGLRLARLERLAVGIPPVYPCIRGVAVAD
jgi:ubiquinone/menaquinone biosynthesis C-methylase UbiE